jgi:hypothetical protein
MGNPVYNYSLNQGIYKSGWKYYRGDFHAHSDYSDGHIRFSDIPTYMNNQRMDFIAMTEHNTLPFVLPNQKHLFIPSFELTLPKGHMNVHGIDQPPTRDLMTYMDCSINTLLDNFKGDTNISINHMFMDPWEFQMIELDLSMVNTIEVICDPTYPTASKANDKAVAFLDFLWDKGIHLYGIGGSDCHLTIEERYEGANEPSVYGDPGTYVYAKNLSSKCIIDSVKKGMTYVSRYCELDIDINQGETQLGQRVEGNKLNYEIMIRPFQDVSTEGWQGLMIMDGRIIEKFDLGHTQHCKWSAELDSSVYHWIRFGIYDSNHHVLCYVNPVYCGAKKVDTYRLKDLLKEFNL